VGSFNLVIKKLFLAIGVLLCLVPPAAAGQKIAVLLSSRLRPYEDARQGFEQFWNTVPPQGGMKSIQAVTIDNFVLSEEPDVKELRRRIAARQPALLLAVGSNSLAFLKKFHDIPIIYLMVPYPQAIIAGQANVTGVNLEISPTRQLAGFLDVLPGLKRLGLVYDPNHTGGLVAEARVAARARGLILLAREAHSTPAVNTALEEMAGRIDAFWMLPDLTVTTPQTVELILLFSLENQVPVFTFSKKYLKLGAMVSISFDAWEMGGQAGKMARRILSGVDMRQVPPEKVETVKTEVNDNIAKKLNIIVNPNKTGH